MTKKVLYFGGLTFLSWVLFSLSASLFVDYPVFNIPTKLLAISLFGLAIYRPSIGIGVFLAIMPFFGGSGPSDSHTIYFIGLLTVLDLALCVTLLRQGFKDKHSPSFKTNHPLVFAAVIYWIVALLSLSTITPNEQLLPMIWPDPLGAYNFFALTVEQKTYPWLAWLILTEALLLGFVIYNLNNTNPLWSRYWTFCVLFGLLNVMILGILDYYGLINLIKISPNLYGEAYRHQRLLSLFGNPGWFAQYITLATPAVLSILTLVVGRRIKIVLMIVVMLLTELTLILSFQRGGWITYPFQLLAIWFCVYVFNDESQTAIVVIDKAKKAAKYILLSILITMALSISLVYGIYKLTPAATVGIDTYVARLISIKSFENRAIYWDPTILMLKSHPVFGGGNESFAYQFDRLYLVKDAPHSLTDVQRTNDIMQGSAHNMYFQALSGKGTLGLLSLLFLMYVAITTCWSLAFNEPKGSSTTLMSSWHRLILMMGISFTTAMGIYGFVGEIFYVPINYILFIFFYALVIREIPIHKVISRQGQIFALIILLFAFLVHLVWEYVYPGASRDKLLSNYNDGCYTVEGDPNQPAEQFRWCSPSFTAHVPVVIINEKPNALFSLVANTPAREDPFIMEVYYSNRLVLSSVIDRGKKVQIPVPLPDSVLLASDDSSQLRYVALDIRTNDSFVPFLHPIAPSRDNRNLSVQWYFNQ